MLSMRILLVACFLLMIAPTARAQADLVVHGARIYTVDDERPQAEAMAVRDGRILMVGSDADVLGAYPDAARLDVQGQTVLPGLIDAHAHLMGLGETLMQVDLVGAASKADVLERLRAFAATLPEEAWLTGRGWDQNDWPEQRFPTRADLDAAFPERPVWLVRVDGHAAWANTAALRAAGLDRIRQAADPEGGRIVRDAQGDPTGVFVDAAMELVGQAVPPMTEEQAEDALRRALEQTARYGLTGVHDAGADLTTIRRYRAAINAGRFPLRVYAMIGGLGATFDHYCAEGPLYDYEGRLSVRSIKFYIDGALGSRGAALLTPYSDDPDNRGLLFVEPDTFQARVRRAMECGLQVNTHAIGDRGNRVVLDAYEAALQATGETVGRHRIEHAQIVAPDDLPRFADLDVIASVQPTHATSDMPWAEERLGPERLRGAYAWRTLLDSGARLALGSDFPVEHVDPLLGFYAAVARQDHQGDPKGGWLPEERVTREEALRGFTLDAAYASFMEDEVGSLSPGKRADFVVLDRDVMTVSVPQILEAEVVATYLDGQAVYQRNGE